MHNNKLISIIIANYNGEKYLSNCLNSVLSSSYRNIEVLMVDDGSTDRSVEIIQEFITKDKRVNLLKNINNLGASASRNKAIKRVKGDVVIFLDNDTQVTLKWIEYLLEPLTTDKTIAAVQALLLDFEKRDLIQMAGGKLMPQTGWLLPFHQWRSYRKVKKQLIVKNIVAISAALAVKKNILEKIGGFDEKEAILTEDLDFCWRVWLAGFKIVLAPHALVYHYSKSVQARVDMNTGYRKIYHVLARNSIRSIIKNYEIVHIFKYLPMTLFVNLAREILVLVRRRDPSAFGVTAEALIWNMLNLKDTIEERSRIQKYRAVTDQKLKDMIFAKGSLIDIYNKYFKLTKLL